ncbi:hypothetical protein V6N13_096248 [Hibiscus sabdariffa]|uniref:Uncharacterized protein n=1 Tax=Hibiscus sabdariffa TaxID=183260 RepID=A0ABR2DGP8_9ROSI
MDYPSQLTHMQESFQLVLSDLKGQGVAFTQNSVLPIEGDIVPAGIGRSFVSRDLLEATSIADALARRMVLNVETASRSRVSVHEVGSTPFFHANMYLHLQVEQVHDESSIRRQKRAAVLPQGSKADVLSVLGDAEDPKEPIYSTGPHRYTLCTTVIDLDEKTLTIFEGNPKKGNISYVFSMSSNDFNCKLVNSDDQRTRL